MLKLRRAGFVLGVVGLALSDGGMHLRMMTSGDALWRTSSFWIGAIGALVGYTGWLLWLSAVLRRRADEVGRGVLLDGLLIGVSSAGAFAVATVLPQMRSTEAQIDQLWFLGCLIADAVVLWMALAVLVTRPSSSRARLILLGLVLHVVVDMMHSAALGSPGFWRMRMAEGLLLITFALWVAVVRVGDHGSGSDGASQRVATMRSGGMVVALGGPGVLLAVRLANHDRGEALVLILVVILTAGLTALRVRGLVSDLAASNATLAHQAHHDHLTGVWNRTALSDHLDRATSNHIPVRAVIYLDLDGFKAVNDVHGHDAGDAVLVEVADRLKQAVRGADRVARLGGDEFVVVVTDVDTDVDAFIARLHRVLNRDSYRWEGTELAVGVSAGVAKPTTPDDVFADLLTDADNAMLAAKKKRKTTAGVGG